MRASFVIEGRMTGLNDYIRAERGNRYRGSAIKRKETDRAYRACVEQRVPAFPPTPAVLVLFTWYEPDARRDCDNVAFAKKFILDGMKQAGVIRDDSRRYVSGTRDVVLTDPDRPRVEVEVVQR